MRHYFKYDKEPEDLGIFYFEYDGEYNTRKIKIQKDCWTYMTEDYNKTLLADQPLANLENAFWFCEISPEEFEKAWQEALQRASSASYRERL